MAPTPVLLPGKSHGWRSLVGCSPWGREESETTEWLHFHFSLSCIGEGNGNPLQCSCLGNLRDGGAWWATVSGVAQSRTRLKQLSSSSSNSINIKLKLQDLSNQNLLIFYFIFYPSYPILVAILTHSFRKYILTIYYILENFHCAVYLPSGSPNPLMERNTELKITAQNVKRHKDVNQALWEHSKGTISAWGKCRSRSQRETYANCHWRKIKYLPHG